MPINRATRQFVRERSNFLCEYCHSSESGSTALFTFDHLLPQSLGGSDDTEILADFPYLTQEDILACLAYAADREQKTLEPHL
jgi:Protein of unknown function (DUF433)